MQDILGDIRVTKGSIKERTLKGKKKFEYLFTKGCSLSDRYLRLLYTEIPSLKEYKINDAVKEDDSFNRGGGISLPQEDLNQITLFAFCVSRRVGKAVFRNRLKRVLREACREIEGNLRPGYWIALLPGRSYECLRPEERKKSLTGLLKRAGILEK